MVFGNSGSITPAEHTASMKFIGENHHFDGDDRLRCNVRDALGRVVHVGDTVVYTTPFDVRVCTVDRTEGNRLIMGFDSVGGRGTLGVDLSSGEVADQDTGMVFNMIRVDSVDDVVPVKDLKVGDTVAMVLNRHQDDRRRVGIGYVVPPSRSTSETGGTDVAVVFDGRGSLAVSPIQHSDEVEYRGVSGKFLIGVRGVPAPGLPE